MFSVPMSNFPGIGYNGQLGTELNFDPLAARDPDGPKFRLADYNVEEKRDAESRHVTNRDADAERTRSQRQSDIDRHNRAPDSAGDKKDVLSDDATPRIDEPHSGETVSPKTEEANTSNSPPPASTSSPINSANSAEETSAEDTPVAANRLQNQEVPDEKAPVEKTPDKKTPVAANSLQNQEAPVEKVPAKKAPVAANSLQNQQTSVEKVPAKKAPVAANSLQNQEAPVEKVPAKKAPVAANSLQNQEAPVEKVPAKKAPVAANSLQDQEASEAGASKDQKSGATTTDPKLTALEKLTKSGHRPSATAPRIGSGGDPTAYKLPIPWPPQTRSEQTHNGKTIQLGSANQSGPKIEVVNQALAAQAATTESMLSSNKRTTPLDGQAKPSGLPTPGETIAAAAALNSRAAQSNALAGPHVKQSNAGAASNGRNGNKTATNQTQQTPTLINQTPQTSSAATAFNAATHVQSAALTPEHIASARRQAAIIPLRQDGQHGSASRSSPAADLASQGTGSGFTDTLKAASGDRMTATQDRQTLPTPATEQVKVKLVKAAQGGLDKIKIQLSPSELGKVEVRLEISSDGAVRGTVIADKAGTMELLQRDAKQLERALQDAGFETSDDSLDFQMRGGGTNERQQQTGSGNGPLSHHGGDSDGSDEQSLPHASVTEQDGIGDDGSLNLVA